MKRTYVDCQVGLLRFEDKICGNPFLHTLLIVKQDRTTRAVFSHKQGSSCSAKLLQGRINVVGLFLLMVFMVIAGASSELTQALHESKDDDQQDGAGDTRDSCQNTVDPGQKGSDSNWVGDTCAITHILPSAEQPTYGGGDDCPDTLQSKIDAVPAGGTVTLDACVYRSEAVVDKPLTIVGQEGTEIRGSDDWSGDFSQEEGSGELVSSKTVPTFAKSTAVCLPGRPECNWPEQIFVDGVELEQVASGSSPGARQFTLDGSRHIILGDDPAGQLIEVSTRTKWINVDYAVGNVTFDGIKAKHAANPRGGFGAIYSRADGAGNVVIKNSDLSYAHSAVVTLAAGTNPNRVDNSHIHHGGELGISQYLGAVSIVGNEIYENNTQGFDPNYEAGGIKNFRLSDEQIQNNHIHHNNGWGLWCDFECSGGDKSNNKIDHNSEGGLFHEISLVQGRGVSIHDNNIWENGWSATQGGAGLEVNNSTDIDIYENIIAWNPIGFQAIRSDRSEGTNFHDVTVHDNYIASKDYETMAEDDTSLRQGQANAWYDWVDGVSLYSAASGSGGANKYYYPDAEGSAYGRYKCTDWTHSLSAFDSTLCGGRSVAVCSLGGLHCFVRALCLPTGPPAQWLTPSPWCTWVNSTINPHSVYLSPAEKDSLFASRGVPTAPEH